MASLGGTPLFAMLSENINPVFWGAVSVPESPPRFRVWAYSMWGATVAGRDGSVASVTHCPFRWRVK